MLLLLTYHLHEIKDLELKEKIPNIRPVSDTILRGQINDTEFFLLF